MPIVRWPSIEADPLIELGLRSNAVRAIRKLENIKQDPVGDVNEVGNKNHYRAARREAGGEVVARKDDGTPFDHIQDLQQAADGLEGVRTALEAEQRNPSDALTKRGRKVLLVRYSQTQAMLSACEASLVQ